MAVPHHRGHRSGDRRTEPLRDRGPSCAPILSRGPSSGGDGSAYWSVSLIVPAGLFLLLLVVFPNGRAASGPRPCSPWVGLVFSRRCSALSEILLLPRMEVTTEIVIDNPTNVGQVRRSRQCVDPRPGVPRRWGRRTRHPVPPRRWGGTPAAPLVRVRRGRRRRIGSVALTVFYFADRSTGARTRVVRRGIDGDDAHRHRCRRARRVRDRRAPVPTVGPRPRDPQNGRRRARHGAHQRDVRGDRGGIGALVGSRLDTALAFTGAAILAVAFQPILRRAGRFADRLVYGRRATPYEVLSDFSGRVGGAYADDDVLPRMAEILGEGTGADAATVWLHVGRELRPAASWPADRELDALAITAPRFPVWVSPRSRCSTEASSLEL